MPTFPSFRRLVWALPAIALWTACRDTTAPESRGPTVDETTTPSKTSTLGTLGGTVYFSLWPSETVWSIDPNGGSSPVQITTGAVVRVAPGGQRLAVVRDLDQALVTMNVDGTNLHTLRLTGPAIIDITWSPDGKKVAAYTDGLSGPSLIYVYDDSTSAVTTVTAPSRPAPSGSIHWRGGRWVITRLDGQNLPNGGGFLGYGVPAVADAGSGEFVDLTSPTFVNVGSGIFSPIARKAKLDSAGTVFWSGQDWAANHFGIFSGSGSFRLNTGITPDFAFSPKQDAVAAVRQSPITGGTNYFLDIIDWSGPYVRTLYSSTLTAFTGNQIMSVDWSRPKDQKLIISSVTVTPDSIKAGDSFSIQVKLKNDGAVPLTGASPSLSLAPASRANITATPSPATKDLAVGDEATFTYTLSALSEGPDTAVVNASASNAGATVNATVTRNNFSIGSAAAALTIDLHTDSMTVGIDHDFTVTASITNHGSVAVASTSATLTSDPSTGVTISSPIPSTPLVLLSTNATGDIKWTVRSTQSQSLNLHVVASGHDDNIAATVRTATKDLTVNVVDRRLIVTSSADDSLNTAQLKDSVCDVDALTSQNQCTLRAAIQLANFFGGTQSITFNIAGGGIPTIAPASQLPAITNALTLDGTSQTGGWVTLSGASAGNSSGLVFDNGSTVVKGFLISGWHLNGIWYRSGQEHVLTGNRIGTNAAGTAAIPNMNGVKVTGAQVRIGGTAGTSSSSCAGDCNLISGNDSSGVLVGSRGRASIIGNYIGTDLTGMNIVPNAKGVSAGPSDGAATGSIVVGGVANSPGLAPGNVISGNTYTAIAITGGTNHEIAGNLIGLNRTGSALLPATVTNGLPHYGQSGVVGISIDGGTGAEPLSALIGGSAGRMNVISGFLISGIDVAAADVEHVIVQGNRIGTVADGTAIAAAGTTQISNGAIALLGGIEAPKIARGVGYGEVDTTTIKAVLEVRDNLISGNFRGIGGATVATGNFIGTDVTGTSAIPNSGAVDEVKQLGGIRPIGSRTCESPCNLISGNIGWAVEHTVQGNFIGTDITGMKALPNQLTVTSSGMIGGASGALGGICDRACNLISGNTEAGIAVVDATIQGNVIGAAIDGSPLPNNSSGIFAQAGSVIVGGEGNLGNVILNNKGYGVAALAGGRDLTAMIVQGNSIFNNYSAGISELTNRVTAPTILSVTRSGATITVTGTIPGYLSGVSFLARIDVYASPPCGVSSQGKFPLGHTNINLLSGEWTVSYDNLPTVFNVVTATSTVGNFTSDFSFCTPIDQSVAQTATAGADRLELTSTAGFTIGGWASINPGQSNAETKKITGFGSLIFSSPLIYAHATDEVVVPTTAPAASGWLVSSSGDATAFGGASSFSAKAKSVINAAATPTGRGIRMITKTGVVYSAGDATLFGDATALLNKQEQAVSILNSHNGAGYYIVTNKGRVLAFGDAQSITTSASSTSASDIVAAVQTPSRNGYLMVTACGAITSAGDAQSSSSVPSAKCDVIGAAVPTSGTGAWILHADGHIDATGGAASLGSLTGRFGGLAGIVAQGDGYVIAESNGKLHGFGTTAPTVSGMKGQAAALVPLLR